MAIPSIFRVPECVAALQEKCFQRCSKPDRTLTATKLCTHCLCVQYLPVTLQQLQPQQTVPQRSQSKQCSQLQIQTVLQGARHVAHL